LVKPCRLPGRRASLHSILILGALESPVEMNALSWLGTASVLILASGANAQPRTIDAAQSVMTVRVYKAGLLSALGHDHEIAAPIAGGMVDTTARQVELHAKAGALKVHDTEGSEKDHAEIQSTMLGPQVLDAERYSEIVF